PDNITVIIARFDGEGLNEVGQGDDVGHRVFALNEPGMTPAAIERQGDGPTEPMRASRRSTAPSPAGIATDPPVVESLSASAGFVRTSGAAAAGTGAGAGAGDVDVMAPTLETIDTK